MSGRIITLFRKTAFEYKWMPASTTQVVTIRRQLKVPPFYYYWFGVRVHAKDIGGRGTFNVELYQTLPSSQDPQEFTVGFAPPTYTPAMAIAVSSTGSAPALATPVTSTNLGPYFKVILRATSGASPGTTFYAELSAVLHVRAP
jgi:hypothetical protein